MKRDIVKILGVKVSTLNFRETLELIRKWLNERGDIRFVVTPNPEFLVKASKDMEFKKILNSADLSIPDGSKLIWASKDVIKERVAGVDLMTDLCRVCEEKALTVGLIGGAEKIADRTAECLRKKFPKLKIKIWETTGVDVLFVALGMGKQEKWIWENREKLRKEGVRLAMGVGGAFDYISGAVPRAPKFIRDRGLEWLFRLVRQPWRLKRQLRLLEFVYLILRQRNGRI